jgi:uncharacterized protein YycO
MFSDDTMIYPALEIGQTILNKNKRYFREYVFELDVTAKQEKEIRDWAESQIGVPYDYTALAPFNVLIPRKKKSWKDSNIWMCSEFCAYGLELAGIELFPDNFKKIKPSDLFDAIKNCPKAKLVKE